MSRYRHRFAPFEDETEGGDGDVDQDDGRRYREVLRFPLRMSSLLLRVGLTGPRPLAASNRGSGGTA